MRGKQKDKANICPFCRTPPPKTDEEDAKRVVKLVEKGNADACQQLAGYYAYGTHGLLQDEAKASELWLKAGELGCADAYYNLGISYKHGRGVEINSKKAKHYYELAAMEGCADSRHNLGCLEGEAGHYQREFKHYMIAAKAGLKESFDMVKNGFMNYDNCVTKDEYEETLRAYHNRQLEMKSEARDKVAAIMVR